MNGFNPYAPAMPYIPNFNNPAPQQQGSNVNWVYVNGIDGARNQIVQPNQVVWMMDNSDPRIYVKAVDSVGSVTLKVFDLSEINPNALAANANIVAANAMSAYVTKDDLDALESRIKNIEKEIGGIVG